MRATLAKCFDLEPRLAPAGLQGLVRDIYPGADHSYPNNLTGVNHLLFLSAEDGTHGTELWRSNGSAEGTVMVKDLNPGPESSYPSHLHNFNGTLFFSANTAASGRELWKSDGTSDGTVLVKDINPGTGGSFASNFMTLNNLVYFVANNGTTGVELWRTDGTSAGTVLVKDVSPGSGSGLANPWRAVVNGKLFFYGYTPATGGELWVSDGTSDGTNLVKDIAPGGATSYPQQFVNVNNVCYFTANSQLWRSDGTSAGTTLVRNVSPSDLTNLGGTLVFAEFTSRDLWRSDGTSSGTFKVLDIFAGASDQVQELVPVGSTLFFRARGPGLSGSNAELFKSDGTSSGTSLVRDIIPGEAGSVPAELTNVNGTLYFTARQLAGSHASATLWQSDGTSSGTTRVLASTPGSYGTYTVNLANVNGTLYFASEVGTTGDELHNLKPYAATATTSSPGGVYSTGQTINLVIDFDEPVTLSGGNLLVTLNTGTTLTVPPFSGSSLTVPYTVAVGETTPSLDITSLALTGTATLRSLHGAEVSLRLPLASLRDSTNLIINPLAPTTISSVIVNANDPQRSSLTAITVTLATPVNAADFNGVGDIVLTRTLATTGGTAGTIVQTGATGANGRIVVSPASGLTSTLTLTLMNANGSPLSAGVERNSLAEGRWQLSIPYFNYTSVLNDTTLRRLFGDSNNSGQIDATDLADFGAAYGQTGPDNPFDADGNGSIDASDLAIFGSRFGVTL